LEFGEDTVNFFDLRIGKHTGTTVSKASELEIQWRAKAWIRSSWLIEYDSLKNADQMYKFAKSKIHITLSSASHLYKPIVSLHCLSKLLLTTVEVIVFLQL
jgi:hypothetical protein